MAIAEWVLTGGLLAGIGYMCVRSLISSGRRGRLHLLALRRAPRARRAAAEAALDDPAFAPERIEAAVASILELTETLWRGSEQALRGRRDEKVIRAWARNAAEVLGSEARLGGRPHVDILNVVNREREAEDRVVMRVRVHVDRGPHVPVAARHVHLDERWALVHHREHWYLATSAGDPLAESVLRAPLIASPEDDAERLLQESLEEMTEDAGRGGLSPAELTDAAAPPLRQLEDLSVADDRFDPLLIEAAVKHIVEAWEQSADGRDARLRRWEVTRVNSAAAPPQVEVRVGVRAAAWTDGRVQRGEDRRTRRFELVWTLERHGAADAHPPWRLIHSADAS